MKFTIMAKDPAIMSTLNEVLELCNEGNLRYSVKKFLVKDNVYAIDCEGTKNHLAFLESYFGKENVKLFYPIKEDSDENKEEKKPMDKIFITVREDGWYAKEAYAHESVARAHAARHNLLFKDDPNDTERVIAVTFIDREPEPPDKREYNFRCRVHISQADKNIYLDDVVYTYEGPRGFERTSAREFIGVIPIMDQRVLDQVFRLSYEKLGSPLGSIDDFTLIIDEEDMLR